MRICRLILAAGVATALLYASSGVSTQSASGATRSSTTYDALTPGELYQLLFGESVADAKRLRAALETVSALQSPQRIQTDPFGSLIRARQVGSSKVAQRTLANSQSNRAKPRRTRPAPGRSSRPKSISQRTRQVGKEARARSTARLKDNKARAKQRIKRTPVPARRQSNASPDRKKPKAKKE